VTGVLALKAAQTTVGEMRDLRNRAVRIGRRFDVGPFSIKARTLDSLIFVRAEKARLSCSLLTEAAWAVFRPCWTADSGEYVKKRFRQGGHPGDRGSKTLGGPPDTTTSTLISRVASRGLTWSIATSLQLVVESRMEWSPHPAASSLLSSPFRAGRKPGSVTNDADAGDCNRGAVPPPSNRIVFRS